MFKNWMSFEEKHGDEDRMELVRSRVANKSEKINEEEMEVDE